MVENDRRAAAHLVSAIGPNEARVHIQPLESRPNPNISPGPNGARFHSQGLPAPGIPPEPEHLPRPQRGQVP